ncbi:MAG: hypothetical protein FWF79_02440 [Defluviitaleaceae bacterium]|nr:hypothetical protein [Defluviitaleaceae bacterium]
MVITVSMLILSLALAVLTVTAASSRITARYGYFHGMYDLAVAGNEQAFYVIRRGLRRHSEGAHERVQAQILETRPGYILPPGYYMRLFIAEILPDLRAEIADNFTRAGAEFWHEWQLSAEFFLPDGVSVRDDFSGVTSIVERPGSTGEFYIRTRVGTAFVQSRVIWNLFIGCEFFCPINGVFYINCLDYSSPEMLELLRIAD